MLTHCAFEAFRVEILVLDAQNFTRTLLTTRLTQSLACNQTYTKLEYNTTQCMSNV